MVVGAKGDDTAASDAGAVDIYDLTNLTALTTTINGETTTASQTLYSPDAEGADWFEFSVAASCNSIIVGAPKDIKPGIPSLPEGPGTAYIYTSAAVSVPEVSAAGSFAAFATLLTPMAFLWERRRMVDPVV